MKEQALQSSMEVEEETIKETQLNLEGVDLMKVKETIINFLHQILPEAPSYRCFITDCPCGAGGPCTESGAIKMNIPIMTTLICILSFLLLK